MAEITSYVFEFVEEFVVVFSSDVQTTTIAIAITSSLCCSLVWFFISLASGQSHPVKMKKQVPAGGSLTQPSALVSSFHLRGKNSVQARSQHPPVHGTNSKWARSILEKNYHIPCIRCSSRVAGRYCRMLLCEGCCHYCKDDVISKGCLVNEAAETPHIQSVIDMSFQKLEQCPDRVGYLGRNLFTLNLSNNHLNKLPDEICFLTGLRQLFVQHNSLSSLPSNLASLGNLIELDLRNNKLSSLHSSIGHLANLQMLRLDYNLLNHLPPVIGDLTHLEDLSLSHNQVVFVPEEICKLHKLKRLFLGNNPLSRLPASISQLILISELDVSHCHLVTLPESLSNCSHLAKLSANNNRLLRLPCHLGHLHHLKEVHVEENNLSSLPASLAALNLNVLAVNGNSLVPSSSPIGSVEEFVSSSEVKALRHPRTLAYIAASVLVQLQLTWPSTALPAELQEVLNSVKYCSTCEKPLFLTYHSKLYFSTISGSSRPLPLIQHICHSHYSPPCRFIDYVT